jgi:alpha-glucosidase
MEEALPWWQDGVIYQLLVPSFYDAGGDGFGDLQGMSQKLDYLEWLGVDAVWLSPIYSTPFRELGYDVSDYENIYEGFGTLSDFDALLAEAHRRDLRVILDWVPNHTSSEHPWFEESRSSRDNARRDWYVWRDPGPDGGAPTNWLGIFGGSVWAYDEPTGQYYLHVFLEEQPDLNWRHPDVRQAHYDAMRFWLDRGVDGFRIDALDLIVEDDAFRDNPPNPGYNPEVDGPDMAVLPVHTRDHPRVHEIAAEMRRIVDAYHDDRLLLGELYLGPEELAAYYGHEAPELHLPLNPIFAGMEWSAEVLREAVEMLLAHVPDDGWPTWAMSTHDGRRIASRAGWQQAGPAALMLLTLRGTPILYYGDEIGMHDVEIPPDRQVDPQGRLIGRNRDPVRTPMQWDAGPNAGFSAAEPWLPVPEDHQTTNVNVQTGRRSLLEFHRKMLALRRREPALARGTLVGLSASDDVLAYVREAEGTRMQIVLNLGPVQRAFDLQGTGSILLSTYMDREETAEGVLKLRPNEGVLVRRSEVP